MVAYAVVVRSCGEISGAVGPVLVAVLESGAAAVGAAAMGQSLARGDCFGFSQSEPLHGCFISLASEMELKGSVRYETGAAL